MFTKVRQGIFATMVPTCVYFCVVFKNVFGKNDKANAQMSKDIQSQNLLAFDGRAINLYIKFWFERYCFRQLSKATCGLKIYKSNKYPRVYIHVGALSRPTWCTGSDAMSESAAEVSGWAVLPSPCSRCIFQLFGSSLFGASVSVRKLVRKMFRMCTVIDAVVNSISSLWFPW